MRVAVLGAGMTGLVAAHRLAADHEVDVYERWPGLGGQVATVNMGEGVLLERYYHHLFTSDVHIAALYEELGMDDAIEWLPSSVAMFSEGRSHPFTTPVDLLRFGPLPILSRLRMGLAVLLLQRHEEPGPFEAETARSWITRRMGRPAWDAVWGPMLRGKFGSRADDISMAWIWRKLTLRRQVKGKEARQEMLGYPRGGWQPLLDRLADDIEKRGGRVLIDRPARELDRSSERLSVSYGAPDSFRAGHDPRSFTEAGREEYDRVVATVPSDVFISLLSPKVKEELGEDYLGKVGAVEYHAALCLLLELDREFSPYYWTNIADREIPFVGLIEQTNLIVPERYGGRRFLYVANYLEQGHELLSLSPDELIDCYTPGLQKVNPEFSPDWIRQRWMFREPAAQPVVTVGYQKTIPALQTPSRGLLLANTTQIYPEDRGTNYSVRLGDEAAKAVTG